VKCTGGAVTQFTSTLPGVATKILVHLKYGNREITESSSAFSLPKVGETGWRTATFTYPQTKNLI